MDIAAYREKLRQRAAENRLSFQGEYREQIKGLLGLSREEVDRMTPGTSDLETYDHLITMVKTASETNLSQALLREEIKRLGELGVQIAGKVPALAKLLV